MCNCLVPVKFEYSLVVAVQINNHQMQVQENDC